MFKIHNATEKVHEEKETIHSGHFMVSHFEAEEQDDEDEVAVPVPEDPVCITTVVPVKQFNEGLRSVLRKRNSQQQLEIDTSLSKLFQCMSLAYRQKLTSPKWNRFRGIRLRWKDKIRLNNVIWRCWHLQFIKKANTLLCQFASPLEVDTHNKPEAVVLEGKYWKRKLAACTAEYKKWRMFYRNHVYGHSPKDISETLSDVELLMLDSQNSEENMHMMVDEDYMGLMSDTLFSTITNQPFVFPDSREIAKAGLADFIQPSLGPLQPNLDDYMDTFEPLQEFISYKLPTVPEEQSQESIYKPLVWNYSELENVSTNSDLQVNASETVDAFQPIQNNQSAAQTLSPSTVAQVQSSLPPQQQQSQQQYQNNLMLQRQQIDPFMLNRRSQPPSYQASVISKTKEVNNVKMQPAPMEQQQQNIYQNFSALDVQTNICVNERFQSQAQNQPRPEHLQVIINRTSDTPTSMEQIADFKFTPPVTPNYKYTSQVPHMHHMHPVHSHYNTSHSLSNKEDKVETRIQHTAKGRQRSRSNTREPIKRPPLISASSDPALVVSNNNTLLTKLLTSSTESSKTLSRNRSTGSLDSSAQIIKKEENSPVSILPQQPATTLIITPVNISSMQDPLAASDTSLLNSFSSSNSPILDSSNQSINSPTSSQSSIGSPSRESCVPRDFRRAGHIQAEQKRRYTIKNGFDMLYSLIPHLNQNPNAKLAKAAMLQKGAEYIRQLKIERNQLKEEMDMLKQQIDALNTSISNCQSLLPATGAPVSRRRDTKMQEMYDEYVKTRTMENWKFWIFSLLFKPLLSSFNNIVSTSSLDDLYRSTMLWIEQHCTLAELRPVVLNSLRYLSTKTDILSEPEKLPEEVRQEVLVSTVKKQ